jgi:hypothetical protein
MQEGNARREMRTDYLGRMQHAQAVFNAYRNNIGGTMQKGAPLSQIHRNVDRKCATMHLGENSNLFLLGEKGINSNNIIDLTEVHSFKTSGICPLNGQ